MLSSTATGDGRVSDDVVPQSTVRALSSVTVYPAAGRPDWVTGRITTRSVEAVSAAEVDVVDVCEAHPARNTSAMPGVIRSSERISCLLYTSDAADE